MGLGIGYINQNTIKNELKNGTLMKLDLGIGEIEEKVAIVVKNFKLLSSVSLRFIEKIKDNIKNH